MPAAVTPSGVRDGDRAALAGLCAVRGPSVLAYCRHLAGDSNAADAAADAFARFRAAVVAMPDLADVNPETLLLATTRRAAASRAPRAPLGVCAVVPLLLAARADKTISREDLDRLEQHLDHCWPCREPVARLEAAERAYRDPPAHAVDPSIVTQIIAAMVAAAPAHDAEPAAASTNGRADEQATAGVLAVASEGEPAAAGRVDRPAMQFHPPDLPGPAPAPAQTARSDGPAEPARSRGRFGAGLPRLRGAATGAPPSRAPGRRRSRQRSRPRLPVMLPIAVVLLAVLVAFFVSGVLGGGEPASSPRVEVPADVPTDTVPAEVIVVPGAAQASADDVEEAKARARAKREREAAVTPEPEAAPATAPPAAATPPPAAATNPPPPPARETTDGNRSSASGRSRRVDAGNGATGAEQIPAAEDTSTVPDLAPPPEPATAP